MTPLKKFARTVACWAVFAVLAACGPPSDPAADSPADRQTGQLTIASNPAGTHTFTVAGGLARILQEERGVRATIRPFSGSSVYLPMLQRGEIALGLNTGIDSYVAYRGLPPYQDAMPNLRLLGMMFPLRIMYMVRADSGLRAIEDLRGKRVVVVFRANAALEQLHLGILATGGLTVDDVEPMTVAGLPEAMRMLTEGRADAVPTGLNTALSLQVDSTLPGGIRYLTMGQDEARLAETMPGVRIVTALPDATTPGVEGPTRVSWVADFLNTGTHTTDDEAYRIIKTIHENWEELRRDYVQMRTTTAEAVVPADNLHPYHPGAVRYFREAGLWTEAHEANQASVLNN
ncbi:TAXI family TRAP transporter solute-binding subunit [Candidatus Rariloculus sp.]|uniref:TAXI family TRAP transporter solute-binding subunit n=1 Tax=Candidatus Rariloculus sp. TaxID=3101265 RepID=UPI003D0D25E1